MTDALWSASLQHLLATPIEAWRYRREPSAMVPMVETRSAAPALAPWRLSSVSSQRADR